MVGPVRGRWVRACVLACLPSAGWIVFTGDVHLLLSFCSRKVVLSNWPATYLTDCLAPGRQSGSRSLSSGRQWTGGVESSFVESHMHSRAVSSTIL